MKAGDHKGQLTRQTGVRYPVLRARAEQATGCMACWGPGPPCLSRLLADPSPHPGGLDEVQLHTCRTRGKAERGQAAGPPIGTCSSMLTATPQAQHPAFWDLCSGR